MLKLPQPLSFEISSQFFCIQAPPTVCQVFSLKQFSFSRMDSLTFTDVPHPLWSEQEKSTFLVFIGNCIEHAVPLVANHVLRPPRVVDQEGARDAVGRGPVKRKVEAVGSRHWTQQGVEHLGDGMVDVESCCTSIGWFFIFFFLSCSFLSLIPRSGGCASGRLEVSRGEACHNLHLLGFDF